MVLNYFEVKYSGKENSLQLKSEIEDKYKLNTDWEVKLYIRVAVKWGYEKGMVRLSITGYIRAALNSFQHEKPKIPQDSLYHWTQPIYEKNQMIAEKGPAEELDENN